MKKISNPSVALLAFTLATAHAQTARYQITDEDANGPGSPRVVVLHDNTARAEAAVAPSEGGELSSYKIFFQGKPLELLYHARDYTSTGFHGKAPLLWPAVGMQYPVGTIPKESCGNGTYPVAGKTFPMPCHGFARSLPWKEISRSADVQGARVTVELTDSARTRPDYPFGFKVDVTYELSGGLLTLNYTITADAANTTPMPFSIGNHIAFRVPLVEGSDPAAMTFETPNTTQLLRYPGGVGLNGEEKPSSYSTPQRLGDFDAHVALPLSGYRSMPYARLVDPAGLSVRITQTASTDPTNTDQAIPNLSGQLIRFNVYGGPHEGYLSPEPWFGLINSLNSRKGFIDLAPGGSWRWRIQVAPGGPAPAMQMASPGVERFGGGFGYVEGPVWSKDGSLIFSDMFGSRTLQMKTPNRSTIYRNFTHSGNGNSMDVKGRLYTCERDSRRVVRVEKDGKITVIADKFNGLRINDPNDVVVRRDGQVYFSDPLPTDTLETLTLGYAGVYHVTPSGKVSLVTKMLRPNGVALTPDGKTLYIADTTERKILAYDLDANGAPSNGRTFITGIDGGPDGLRVAANGNVYIACRGVAIYSPAGKFLKMIEFPEMPSNLTFGDQDLQTIYVTARTSIYRVRVVDNGSLQY